MSNINLLMNKQEIIDNLNLGDVVLIKHLNQQIVCGIVKNTNTQINMGKNVEKNKLFLSLVLVPEGVTSTPSDAKIMNTVFDLDQIESIENKTQNKMFVKFVGLLN